MRIPGNKPFFSPPPCRAVRNSTVVFGCQDDNGVNSGVLPATCDFDIPGYPKAASEHSSASCFVTRAREILRASVWRSKPMSTCATPAAIFWSGAQVAGQMKVPARGFLVLF